ncbi:hypothetical protein FOXG_18890 [Fusarium oxysporum f. sp. lycopersici 4287]|uniref:Uncharacterized protein n=2 Tax=Fusarium oxysporum TaxID=5507 RepID=A0A0J9UR89_FUSO4|nr:hypothetical protein FOXG_18890 [Fusarium oxysporum f. sp. lycopersici 4287]EXK27090.1 hypothetical protein FOMG_16351 [Fusarium oxysporum f. sp. melonis 26406]KNB01493.1 hypothetical protein FOXG_18890 [Fusarium oxysporum f. sp. lycopersici 4287]
MRTRYLGDFNELPNEDYWFCPLHEIRMKILPYDRRVQVTPAA